MCVPDCAQSPAINDRISALDLLIENHDYSRNGGLNMRWILIIVLAIAVEFFVRFLTRNMEDKKKREKLLARHLVCVRGNFNRSLVNQSVFIDSLYTKT